MLPMDSTTAETCSLGLFWQSDGQIWVCQFPGEQYLSDFQSVKLVGGGLWCGVVFQELPSGYNEIVQCTCSIKSSASIWPVTSQTIKTKHQFGLEEKELLILTKQEMDMQSYHSISKYQELEWLVSWSSHSKNGFASSLCLPKWQRSKTYFSNSEILPSEN